MYQHTKDILSGLAFLIIALVFQSQSLNLSGISRIFPQALIIFLIIGSIYLLAKGTINFKKKEGKDTEVVVMSRVGIISAISFAYILLVPVLGFFAASIIFLFFSAIVFRDKHKTMVESMLLALGFTIIFCVFVWLSFVYLLNVPTPEGMFF